MILRTRACCWALLLAGAIKVPSAQPNTLALVRSVELPGVKGRFDHFAIDTNRRHLFLAALGNNTLEIIVVAAGKRVHSIRGLHKPTRTHSNEGHEDNRIAVS